MVIVSPLTMFPFQMAYKMAYKWGAHPFTTYIHWEPILQVYQSLLEFCFPKSHRTCPPKISLAKPTATI